MQVSIFSETFLLKFLLRLELYWENRDIGVTDTFNFCIRYSKVNIVDAPEDKVIRLICMRIVKMIKHTYFL